MINTDKRQVRLKKILQIELLNMINTEEKLEVINDLIDNQVKIIYY